MTEGGPRLSDAQKVAAVHAWSRPVLKPLASQRPEASLADECRERATYLKAMESEGLSTIERQCMETLFKAAAALSQSPEMGKEGEA